MTVNTTTNRVSYAGNGTTTAFAVPFPFLADADLVVIERTDSTGAEVTKTLTTHYTVSGAGGVSGTVTMVTAPATGVTLIIYRDPAVTQLVDLVPNDPLPVETAVEQPLDRLTMIAQRNRDLVERALRLPDSDTGFAASDMKIPAKVTRASKYLAFDADGKPIASAAQSGAVTTAFMTTVLDDPNAAAARRTLGVKEVVGTMAALKALASTGFAANEAVEVLGYYAASDRGGGLFYWDTASTLTDDGIETIRPDAVAAGDPGRWRRIYNSVLDIRMAGVLADSNGTAGNGTDNTVRLQALGTWLSGKKNIRIIGPGGIVRFAAPTSGTIFALSSSEGISFDLPATEFFDDRTYNDGTNEAATLLKATSCTQLTWRVKKITTDPVAGSASSGLTAVQLLQGCRNVTVETEMTGGAACLDALRAAADPASYRSTNITARLKCTQMRYGYLARHSGDVAEVYVDADTCSRNFFVYGTKSQTLYVRSKSQQANSLIKAYSGDGVDGCKVDYYDRDTTTGVAASYVIEISFGDSTAATIRDIDINLNVKNPSAAPWAHAIAFSKYSDGGGTADSVGRGHKLENVVVRGLSDYSGVASGNNHASTVAGVFASPDVQRNITFKDFVGLGTNANIGNIGLLTLDGASTWENVKCEGNIETDVNPSGSAVVFVGCTAANFETASSAARHTYVSSRITGGSLQGITNKTFIDTEFKGVRRNTTGDGLYVARATKMRTGDLTGSANIFKVVPALASGAQFRLKYHLVWDAADTDASTRDETYGIKSFSATMNGSGTWVSMTAPANEVTERVLGSAAALTVTLVNGDATGAFIAVSATVYNLAGSRGVFELEMLPITGFAAVQAV